VHVIGAGLAGLSAALALADRGFAVTLDEAGPRAGGRCRSYRDPQLGLVIDNGNHLLMSGNRAAMAWLDRLGTRDHMAGPAHADFDFCDLNSGQKWRIAANDGPIPWWVLKRGRRVPDTRAVDYLPMARLIGARAGATVGEVIPTSGPLWDRLMDPVLLSALNVDAAGGSARLAGAVIARTLGKGGRASRPLIATPSLDAALVDPALAALREKGVEPRFGRRLRALGIEDGRVTHLDFGNGAEAVAGPVVLAVPAWIAAELVPGLTVPDRHSAIVNAHFAGPPPPGAPTMLALIGGAAQWLFAFEDRVSVTVSGADAMIEQDREALAKLFWADIQRAYGFTAPMPAWQIVKEKRATFAATPDQDALRPGAATSLPNLFLAGDWTQTGLPATIEGALQSGGLAAKLAAQAAAR